MKVVFGIIGFFLGMPLSYFFQAPIIRKIPLSEYIKIIPDMLTEAPGKVGSEMLGSPKVVFIVTCLVCAFLLGVVGHLIDQGNNNKRK